MTSWRLIDEFAQHAIARLQAAVAAAGALGEEHHLAAAHAGEHQANAAQIALAAADGKDTPGVQEEADHGQAEQFFLGRCPDDLGGRGTC